MESSLVTVITSPNCFPCKITKQVLTREGIAFEERNVAEDPAALDEAKALGYMETPVVIAGDRHWSGLRPDLLSTL